MLNTEEKFREIYEKYKNMVLKVAYDLTEDYHTAQDICQRVFEKLYGYQNHVDEERVKSWLVVVAANEARDYCRKGGKFTVLLSGTMELAYLMECENSIEKHLEQRAKREFLERAFSPDCSQHNDEDLKMIGVYSMDYLFSNIKLDDKGLKKREL